MRLGILNSRKRRRDAGDFALFGFSAPFNTKLFELKFHLYESMVRWKNLIHLFKKKNRNHSNQGFEYNLDQSVF